MRVNAGGGCDTVKTRYGWVKFRQCGELLNGRRFTLRFIWTVYKCYVWQQFCMEMNHGA